MQNANQYSGGLSHDLANLLAASRNHPYGHTMPTDQSRQEPITRPAGSDEEFIVSTTKEVCEWLATRAAKENLELGVERDMFKAESERLASGYDAAQSELSALREENERLKSESFEELYNAAIDERDAMRGEVAEIKESLAYRGSLLNRTQQRAEAAEQRNAAVHILSPEAYSTVIGMVEHCLNVRACMGMDEGFKDFDTEEEHDFVKKIRAFVSAALKPTESGARE